MTVDNTKPTSVFYNSLIADMSNGAKRLGNNPTLIEQVPDALLEDLRVKLENYNPVAMNGRNNRTNALTTVNNRIAQLQTSLNQIENLEASVSQPFEAVVEAEKVIQNTVVLEIHIRQPGFGKYIKSDTFSENIGLEDELPNAIKICANIVDNRHIKPLKSAKINFTSWLKARAMPSNFLANGMFLVPISLIGVIDEQIAKLETELNTLLDEFQANYQDIIEESKQNLGVHFNPANYPAFESIRQYYKVEARYLTLNVPAALERVNKDLFEKEKAKSQQMWADATQDIRDGLRQGFKGLIDHFIDKLGKDEAGKNKVFHGSTVDKLKEFVTTFADRNLTNDVELANLATDAQALLNNVDPKSLRKDETFRLSIEEEFKKIQEVAEKLIVVKTRKLDLED